MTDRDGAKKMGVWIPKLRKDGQCRRSCPLCESRFWYKTEYSTGHRRKHFAVRCRIKVCKYPSQWCKSIMFPGPKCVQYQGGKDE